MKKLLPFLLALLLLAGCAQKNKTEEVTETSETTAAVSEPQTALETVADAGEHEIRLPITDDGMTVSASLQDSGMHPDFPPKTTSAATAAQTNAAATAKADKETKHETTTTTKPAAAQNTTTTTKPSTSQNTTTTTKAASGGQTPTVSTTAANSTLKTTSTATLPTADAEKDRYELPAIPLG